MKRVTFHSVLKFIVGHVLAGAVVILGTLLVTLVCYIVGLATDSKGLDTPVAEIPFFLSLMFMAGVAAIIASTSSFLISIFLLWLRSKRPFPFWLPILMVPLLTSVFVLLIFGSAKDMQFMAATTGMAFVYFGIYWTILMSSSAVLDFLRSKILS